MSRKGSDGDGTYRDLLRDLLPWSRDAPLPFLTGLRLGLRLTLFLALVLGLGLRLRLGLRLSDLARGLLDLLRLMLRLRLRCCCSSSMPPFFSGDLLGDLSCLDLSSLLELFPWPFFLSVGVMLLLLLLSFDGVRLPLLLRRLASPRPSDLDLDRVSLRLSVLW